MNAGLVLNIYKFPSAWPRSVRGWAVDVLPYCAAANCATSESGQVMVQMLHYIHWPHWEGAVTVNSLCLLV